MEQNPYQTPANQPPIAGLNTQLGSPTLTLKQVLFSFTGRIPRRTYWMWYIITMVGAILIAGLIMPLTMHTSEHGETTGGALGSLLMLVIMVPLIWIGLALQVKRWHDRDKSGLWIFIAFIPLVGPIWAFIECGCLRGTVGHNNYGNDPT